ncbi:ABC transporter permease subunit [Ktedonosporobacter rubrisoli]|uniref:ABC transporter permease subunit n=1 Tax=Ktedonosporobacter rubrisoli TaxID=2509675 RepID=A0A4P6K259_KTERU|nr:ABC transporter permease subunit [Ktedonosporobacter rubrisoli]QBD82085.1 ABC transporter permease subunit [Ktedonosporobacter rubrisoli]
MNERTTEMSNIPSSLPGRGMSIPSTTSTQTRSAVSRPHLASTLSLAGIYLFLIIMTVFALFPLYYVLQASLAGDQNLYTTDLHLIPTRPTLDNYIYALTKLPLLAWIANTFIVCGATTLIGVICSMSGAYALSRFRFRGRELSLTLLLTLQAFPALLALPAYYLLLDALGLINNLLGLILVYAGGQLVFGCWNIKGYFDTIPVELEQAAMIDGASHLQAFLRVTLPLSIPALIASAMFIFLAGWNEFAIANLVLNANDTGSNLTFILGVYSLQSDFRTPWGYFAASSVLVTLPLLLLFLYAQRFFQSGLTIGSVKG